MTVINKLPNGKKPGVDGITYEFYKHAKDILVVDICTLFNTILSSGKFPKHWADAIISPLHKKGSINDVSNYRGISLLCCLGKIFTKILNNRLILWCELNGKLEDVQGAYRKGRSTVDHIFSLQAIIHKYIRKRGGRFYVVFVDFARAFDSVPHSNLWYHLLKSGIHGKIISVLQSMYCQMRSCVKLFDGITDYFPCTVGTRQGCMISPLLFALYINELVVKCQNIQCPGIQIDENYSNIHMLLYADDICLFNDTVGRVQTQLDILDIYCSEYGLSVNLCKTKVIVFRNGGHLRKNEKFYLAGKRIESVSYYKYLGVIFSSRLVWTTAVSTLSSQAEKAIFMLKRFIKFHGAITTKLAIDLFDKIVVPILLYGSEIWGTKTYNAVEVVHRKYLKYLLSLSYSTSNAAVMGELGRTPLSVLYKFRCIKYWVNIVQSENVSLRRSLYEVLKRYDDLGGKNWVTDVRTMLNMYGFGDVWLQQGVGNVDLFLFNFKQRLVDTANQEWFSDLSENSKLQLYSKFKKNLDYEFYLSANICWKYKVALARFRCVNHTLAVEKQRHIRCEKDQRLCIFCGKLDVPKHVIEDEIHFILVCPLYQKLRENYISKYVSNFKSLEDNFVQLFSTNRPECVIDLATFLYKAMEIHSKTCNAL